ncbi:peptide ABC transporter substrate-binding protein [Mucisphaera calidilacus]|uniref:Oligopeptide-binding protein OppA n=1 Tax=Mucisphaera calidilacus TaxID=2527982 RepID=A0A518C0N9_9BACT|nr:peptide ABC transporter substrate-binding protein [Mucisphaera calidilacus]QDU72789.1 Oligopeptide-binding protein OppA precursor [Mucisphaera calidilacus]
MKWSVMMFEGWTRGLLGLVVAGALLLTGCKESEPEADLVFIEAAAHRTLDPQSMSWNHDIRIASTVFEPLVRMDFVKGDVEPAAAASWAVSEDGLTYTFSLREGIRWSNGDPVLASDFVFAWRRALLPDTAAQYAELMYCIEGAADFYAWRTEQVGAYAEAGAATEEAAQRSLEEAFARFEEVVGVRAVDEVTLEVRLERPTPYFLQMVGFATFLPVHPASVVADTRLNAETGFWKTETSYWSDPTRLVSNGPFTIEKRVFKQYLRLRKNPMYWDAGRIRLNSILEKIVEDPGTGFMMYHQGEADLSFGIPSQGTLATELLASDRGDVHSMVAAGTYFYNFNCLPTRPDGSVNPLADVRVRRALSMAIDREQLVSRVNRVGQPVARSFVPPGAVPGYEPPVESGVVYDPSAARELLKEAGYEGGEGLDGLSILYNTGGGHEDVAIAVKSMWERELGVVVTTEGVEVRTFGDRVRKQDYSIARAAWFGDYVDPTTWLDKHRSTNGNNDAKWNSAAFDALLDEAALIRDPAERFAKLAEAEALHNYEQPIAPVYHYVTIYLFDPEKVKGVSLNTWARWRFDRMWVERDR